MMRADFGRRGPCTCSTYGDADTVDDDSDVRFCRGDGGRAVAAAATVECCGDTDRSAVRPGFATTERRDSTPALRGRGPFRDEPPCADDRRDRRDDFGPRRGSSGDDGDDGGSCVAITPAVASSIAAICRSWLTRFRAGTSGCGGAAARKGDMRSRANARGTSPNSRRAREGGAG